MKGRRLLLLFAGATLAPFVLLGLAAMAGGVWPWACLACLAAVVPMVDRIAPGAARNAAPEAEFPAAVPLLVVIGIGHFLALGLVVWGAGGASGLSLAQRVALALSGGLIFGQISHPAAHELIHKPARILRRLGGAIYASLLVGHHASAHLLVHHPLVGSASDPNSAPLGESFYRFALRATRQSFLAGLRAENARRARATSERGLHPYASCAAVSAATLGGAFALAGLSGAAVLLAVALHAQLQILMSDYVQHYGLQRGRRPDGRLEPVGPQHSWNAPQILSSALMLNAPRHSDHHMRPTRVYPALQLDTAKMPVLPRSLPAMCALAAVPPLWFRVMNPRCARWRGEE